MCRAHWVSSIPPWRYCFQPCLRGFPPDTGPRSLALPGSSSRELTAASKYNPLYTCTSALASVRLPWGFVPPSRHQHRASTAAGNPTSRLTFRPQRFSRSRRFAPLAALRACFIPLPCPRFTPQGFSPTVSRPGSSPGRSLLTSAPLACTEQARCSSARRPPSGL
jgi:hypothetical protein